MARQAVALKLISIEQRIVAGLKWREIMPPLVLTGESEGPELDLCRELGMTVAGGLDAGLF